MRKLLVISVFLIFSLSGCKKIVDYQYKVKGYHEEGRRKVFEESRSYNAGKEQDLADYYGQYHLANDEDKEIIKNTIKLVFADYDESMFKSSELKSFLKEMKYGSKW
jgi:hypothetical protein